MEIWGSRPNKEELGKFLLTLRKSRRLTRMKVAERSGNLDVKSIGRWENAKALPQRDKLQALLRVLGATPIESEIAHRLAGVKMLMQWQKTAKLWTPLLGDLLRSARIELDLSEQEVADEIGVGAATISHYENHQRVPDVVTLQRLEQFLRLRLNGQEAVPEELDRDGWEKYVDSIELKMITDPHYFLASSVLPTIMERLQLFVRMHPDAMELLFRFWRLWAGWADSQGNFPLVNQISGRMVKQPPYIGGDPFTVQTERIRGQMYQAQVAIHQRLFIEASATLAQASADVSRIDLEDTPALRIQIVRDKARLYKESGNFGGAQLEAERAIRMAEQVGSQKIVDFCSMILARTLVADRTVIAWEGDKALKLLPPLPPAHVSDPTRITYLLGYAEVFTKLGEWREATPFLEQAQKIAKEHNLLYRARQIKDLAKKQK